jgi:P-type Cu+ transporter
MASTGGVAEASVTACKDGCCGDKKTGAATADSADTPAVGAKKACKDGCCGDKKAGAAAAAGGDDGAAAAPAAKKACKDGCCTPASAVAPFMTDSVCEDLCCTGAGCSVSSADYLAGSSAIAILRGPSVVADDTTSITSSRSGFCWSLCPNFIRRRHERRPSRSYTAVEMSAKAAVPSLRKSAFLAENIDCNDCADTVRASLLKMTAINAVVISVINRRVDVTYDSTLLDDQKVSDELTRLGYPAQVAGACTVRLQLSPVDKVGDAMTFLQAHAAVADANMQEAGRVTMTYEPAITGLRQLLHELAECGVTAELLRDPTPDDGYARLVQQWKVAVIWCTILAIPVFIISFILPAFPTSSAAISVEIAPGLTVATLVNWILCTPIQFYFARSLYISAYRSVWINRRANMDVLVVLSTTVGYTYSVVIIFAGLAGAVTVGMFNEIPPPFFGQRWTPALTWNAFRTVLLRVCFPGKVFFDASAILLTLVAWGRYLEAHAKRSASGFVTSMVTMQPSTALLVTSAANESGADRTEEIDTRLIAPGDILRVLPGARVPTDGVVATGSTTVDESLLTGESAPVVKRPGDTVVGGSVNLVGLVNIRATQSIADNTVARLVRLVQSAEMSKPQIARLADAVAERFVPIVLAIVCVVFIAWVSAAASGAVGAEAAANPVAFSLQFALAVLVVSCSCAMALAVSPCVVVASGVAARLGILIKGGAAMESAVKATAVVFDKTGTLTLGRPVVTDVVCADPPAVSAQPDQAELDEIGDVMQLAVLAGSLELGSEHALGSAIVTWARGLGATLTTPVDFEAVAGEGVKGSIVDTIVVIGTKEWLATNGAEVPDVAWAAAQSRSSAGQTTVFVASAGKYRGFIGMRDTVKSESAAVVAALARSGRDVWMLSGDNIATAAYIGAQLGIPADRIVAGAKPKDKVTHVQHLQSSGAHVIMVGDGVNDAAALAQADVGVAMGGGVDMAQESAQIVLSKNDLGDLLVMLDLCHTSYNRMRLNIGWAFLYNIIVIPIAAGVLYPVGLYIPPAFAGLSEILSSVPVILCALSLRWYRAPKRPTEWTAIASDSEVLSS